MDNKLESVKYLVDAIERNGKRRKVLKNQRARSVGYIAQRGPEDVDPRQLISLMMKAKQSGLVEFVRSEPRIEWNETDYPVLLIRADKARNQMNKL